MKKILIFGASGFIGNALYKELCPYFDTYGTYCSPHSGHEKNAKFFQYDLEQESASIVLENLRPTIIISALRGNFDAQIRAHREIIDYVQKVDCKLIFLSSANVFDAFSNYPSREYDKTLSMSVYGRFKIKIENALLRLPEEKSIIARIPMVFGAKSPRIAEIKRQLNEKEAIEVFSNVVINATTIAKLTQQIHWLINQDIHGIYHLGSQDLTHHNDLIKDICLELGHDKPLLKNVYDSNFDRFLAVVPEYNILPENLRICIEEVIKSTVVKA